VWWWISDVEGSNGGGGGKRSNQPSGGMGDDGVPGLFDYDVFWYRKVFEFGMDEDRVIKRSEEI